MNDDFAKKLNEIAVKIRTNRGEVIGEESTKLSFVLPFIRALGYDYSNTKDVIPEYYADFGGNKQNRVDYAIMKNGKPIIFIECKHSGDDNLTKHQGQLASYFASTSGTKFAVLTNGIKYLFYTDMEKTHLLDKTPFLEIDLLNLDSEQIGFLEMFCKGNFNSDAIFKSAQSSRHFRNVRSALVKELANPSDDFIRQIISSFHSNNKPKSVVDMYRPYVIKAIADYEAEIKGIGDVDSDFEDNVNVGTMDDVMTQFVEAVMGFLSETGLKTRTLNTLKHYKNKDGYPYVSYRNCALFYVRFDENKMTAQDIQFLNLLKEQDYRWFRRKTTDVLPVSSAVDLSMCKDRILDAATDIDEAWRIQSQRAKESKAI